MASLPKKRFINTLFRDQANEQGLFLKRVGTLLIEGYSIKEALHFLSKIEKESVGQWVGKIQGGLLTGSTFHKELENLGFSDKVCSQIYLAAQYGQYGEMITRCGEQLIERNKKQNRFRTIATYPVFLLVFLITMLLVMRYLILPHMETMVLSVGSDQNIYTNWIVSLVYYSPQIMVGFVVIVLILTLVLKHHLKDKGKMQQVAYFMRVPVLKNYLKDYYSQFFFMEWGQLLMNGCSFQEVVSIMQGEDSSKLLKETGEYLSKEMMTGKTVHEAIRTLPYFYKEGLLVISHGETLGKLGIEMSIYANYCELQLNDRIEKLMGRLQPIIFCLVAVMILAIYAALMLPIFTMMEGI